MENKGTYFKNRGDMKRSPSELALQELLAWADGEKIHHKAEIFAGSDHGFFAMENGDHVHIPFKNSEMLDELSGSTLLSDNQFLSHNLCPKQCNISATIHPQSSICVCSPTAANHPIVGDNQAVGASSGSSHEHSDDDDLDLEAGPCEQSTNPVDMKRIKRKVSNKESARRSRRKKQAHLVDLEQQVELLQGENASLFKQFADATQQFRESTTNNRVLKSDVEALRAKVKLAEDMVARGPLTSSLSYLLQNYLNSAQDCMNTNMNCPNNLSPIMPAHVGESSPYARIGDTSIGLEHAQTFNSSVSNGVISDTVPDIWTWDSHFARDPK